MEAIEALFGRTTVGALTEPGPDRETLNTILEAAVRAPDHGRLRPWRFTIVEGASRERFGRLMAAVLLRKTPTATEAQLERERAKAFRAPLIIAVGAKVRPHPAIPPVEQILAVGAAVQNLLIAVHALGFSGAWKTGAPAYAHEMKAALGLGDEDAIVGFIYVGTRREDKSLPRPTSDVKPYITELAIE